MAEIRDVLPKRKQVICSTNMITNISSNISLSARDHFDN